MFSIYEKTHAKNAVLMPSNGFEPATQRMFARADSNQRSCNCASWQNHYIISELRLMAHICAISTNHVKRDCFSQRGKNCIYVRLSCAKTKTRTSDCRYSSFSCIVLRFNVIYVALNMLIKNENGVRLHQWGLKSRVENLTYGSNDHLVTWKTLFDYCKTVLIMMPLLRKTFVPTNEAVCQR